MIRITDCMAKGKARLKRITDYRNRYSWYMLVGSVLLALWLWAGGGEAQVEPSPPSLSAPLSLDQYLALFEESQRDEWQQPDTVIQALNLKDGQVVADIGAGSGYFTLRLARAIGQQGMVFALDFGATTIDYLRQRLAKEGIQNIQTILVPHHDPLLIDGSLDLAFLCNTYHHLEDRDVYLRKLRKGLKPNGRIVIVDFYQREGMPVGPPMDMRLSEDMVQKELQGAGLTVVEKLTFLPYQYILIAQPTSGSSAPSPAKGW